MPLNATPTPWCSSQQPSRTCWSACAAGGTSASAPTPSAWREDVFAWDTFRLLAREGVVATRLPARLGRHRGRMLLRVRIIEELASVCTTAASLITGTDLSSRPIVAGGSAALKADVLPDLASRRAPVGLCADRARRWQRRGAPGHPLCAHGRRLCVLIRREEVHHPRRQVADMLVVVARREDGPAGAPGSVGLFGAACQHRGSTFRPRCPRRAGTACRLPWSLRRRCIGAGQPPLGTEGQGMALAQDTLLRARIGHAAIALGRMRGALQIATQYAAQREVFGHAVGATRASSGWWPTWPPRIEAARCLVYSTALRYDAAMPTRAVHASIAKMHATDLCMRASWSTRCSCWAATAT
jgi:hypothetical protein